MYFRHATEIWRDYPDLVPGVLVADQMTSRVSVSSRLASFYAVAESRLATSSEGNFPEIQAWRRVFSRMGLAPTQYRCASESLLRRFRKDKSLPPIHPLIDLCNAISLAFAIPIAVFDTSKITESVEVRYARGSEVYPAFSGEDEYPEPGEVIFADEAGKAHARRWTNRQSRYSAVGNDTTRVLIVAEAMHASAPHDVGALIAAITDELASTWSVKSSPRILTAASARFDF